MLQHSVSTIMNYEKFSGSGGILVLPDETAFLRESSSSTSSYRAIFTDPSEEGLMHSRIVNCSEVFTFKFGLTITTSV